MDNINNIIELAKISHEAESYQDSYKYCSIILENDINNSMAWVNKGVAAAFLTDSFGSKIMESVTLIKKGIELDKNKLIDRDNLIERIKKSYNNYNNNLNDILAGKVKDFAKITIPSGGSTLIHSLGQSINAIQVAESQAPARLLGLELVCLMCHINPKESIYKEANIAFTNALNHSKQNGNYFEKSEEVKIKFKKMFSYLNEEAKSNFPQIQLTTTELSQKKNEGCFIATAAVGNYDHPKVVFLRNYRDSYLLKSYAGKLLVRFYYKISPPIANKISKSDFLKKLTVRLIVNPLVNIIEKTTK